MSLITHPLDPEWVSLTWAIAACQLWSFFLLCYAQYSLSRLTQYIPSRDLNAFRIGDILAQSEQILIFYIHLYVLSDVQIIRLLLPTDWPFSRPLQWQFKPVEVLPVVISCVQQSLKLQFIQTLHIIVHWEYAVIGGFVVPPHLSATLFVM